jgi:hypothetical protein
MTIPLWVIAFTGVGLSALAQMLRKLGTTSTAVRAALS